MSSELLPPPPRLGLKLTVEVSMPRGPGFRGRVWRDGV